MYFKEFKAFLKTTFGLWARSSYVKKTQQISKNSKASFTRTIQLLLQDSAWEGDKTKNNTFLLYLQIFQKIRKIILKYLKFVAEPSPKSK